MRRERSIDTPTKPEYLCALITLARIDNCINCSHPLLARYTPAGRSTCHSVSRYLALLHAFKRARDCNLSLLDSAARMARDPHHRGIVGETWG